ncbi:cytoplasmic protein [Arthrobacter sp. MYb224]|uniref:PH domain-containing protein n=1 Tax=Micrococcaceae TaxID=1268 RepID=UPI000CFAF055|nr:MULTISPECIES: PH domain-containing protein [unclassified Arthrobacter]PQZ98143.1 cytoplasmic protein [Arthrobacter sp. MYb224]PRA02450.1 cytoplasmic protein [Arthrobacter sp. MYb229]PRB50607.1 cytoplasmic protein [Arthrobacter sp. MYb216]
MIDFNNSSVFKLGPWNLAEVAPEITPMLVSGEELLAAFKGARDYVVFTNKRLVAVNVQGLTGKKRDYTSLPYSRIQAFSVETAGTFDLDAELELWFSGLGKVSLDFKGKVDIRALSQVIAGYVL